MRNPHDTAKSLRRSQTDAEKLLWSVLRNGKQRCKFRRQHPVDHYIVDFICIERSLVIELDGGQHAVDKDAVRTRYLEQRGYRIIRFWNDEVLRNKEGVFQAILKALETDV